MFNLTRKGLWAHKVRFLLTGLAVILGVSFMAGTMILTDTMGKTFDGLFATSNEGINAVDGVDVAAGSIEGFAQVVGADGAPLHSGDGVGGTIGVSWIDDERLNP